MANIEQIDELSMPLDNIPPNSQPKPESVNQKTDAFSPIYTDEQMKVINEFYKLKGKYEQTIRRKKQKIMNNPALSKSDKRREWNMEKFKCVYCKKPVGTFFSVKGKKLFAQCGAVNNPNSGIKPCKLRIDMDLATVTTMQDTINSFDKYKEADKEEIIKTKLNLLFGFTSEEEALREFEEKRLEFEDDIKTYNAYLELYHEVHNSKEKRDKLRTLSEQFEATIIEMKTIIKEDIKQVEDNRQIGIKSNFKIGPIRDVVMIQIERLNKIILQLRNLKYDYYAIEENEDNPFEHILVADPISVVRSEVIIDKNAQINHFIVN